MIRSACLSFLLGVAILLAGCSSGGGNPAPSTVAQAASPTKLDLLPGMPPVADPNDIYSEDHVGKISPTIAHYPSLIYVPCGGDDMVDIIDPKTYKVIRSYNVNPKKTHHAEPQHVVPSWDLKTLWATNDLNDTLTKFDPSTGEMKETIPVDDPYNMYYTPDGKYAMVVCERKKWFDFRDPQTMELKHRLPVPCKGVDHVDFSADGQYFIASCEFSSELLKVDVANRKVLGTLAVNKGGMPQDVKTSPDGKVFYVADMMADGVYLVDGEKFQRIGFLPTGKGAHGLYASRDSKVLYVSNRGEASVSVIDFATRKVIRKWKFADKGSPDMGGVSADGKIFWLAGRYDHEVYAIDTSDGHLIARIPTHKGPHGLCVYPQPGRYSLGHTGVFR